VEAEERNRIPVAWIVFLVASVMMLITANLLLNYGNSNLGGTIIDVVGEVLPYGLIAAIFVYYLLKSNIKAYKLSKPTLHGIHAPLARIFRLVFFILGSIFLSSVVIYIIFQGYLLLGANAGITSPSNPTSSTGANPAEVGPPLLDLWSSLSILTVIITAATLSSAIILGRRNERIQETIDEGDLESTKHITSSFNTFVDNDDRTAILSYYAKGREHMVEHGVPLTEATTPREFEKDVLNSISAAGKDFTSLTCLFEEARFSTHNVGGSEKEKAKRHYERVKRTTSVTRRH
jgi:hypothetical protein